MGIWILQVKIFPYKILQIKCSLVMEGQEFLVSGDLTFQPFGEEISSESTIKAEDIKDEEDILLFAQLDNLASNIANNNEYQIVQEVEVVDQLHEPQDEFTSKLPIDLSKFSSPGVHNEGNTSHYVRYKLQGGKHVKIWECGICSKEFSHQYTLMRHLPTHTDERKFQCNTCGKAFRQMSTLSQHRAIHSTERPYICEICHKTFNRVSTLISHRKTHTGMKPHRCHLCTKAFHQKGNLRNHIFTHTNERPYKCDICEKGFNQMSNLMCHKVKAHRRAETPKYICHICGKCFPKRMSLRHHEQYTHDMLNQSLNMPQIPEKLNYMNAIMVDPIKTEAMRLAIESNQTPFALLRPLTGIPVLVRVLPAGDKQMLVPASAEDLKKHSHISITPKSGAAAEKENIDTQNGKHTGSTVQIKIPVVATVIQQSEQGGHMSMAVVSPGPNGELVNQSGVSNSQNDSFVYSSTLTGNESTSGNVGDIEEIQLSNIVPTGVMTDVEIEFLDEHGRRVGEDDFSQHFKIPNEICQSEENCSSTVLNN